MRIVKIQNGDGEVRTLTSKSLFLSNLSGLGYENEEAYWKIGNEYTILETSQKQNPIEGSIIFNGENPYREFQDFMQFVKKAPLVLQYTPYSDGGTYHRKVSITKIEKKELDVVGTLSIPVSITPLGPWYRKFSFKSFTDDVEFI